MAGEAAAGGEVALRPALPEEAHLLGDLALRSKGHWGYDAAFLEACRDELAVRPGDVASRRAVVALEAGGRVVGFYTLDGEPPRGELGMLFVEPDRIGTGVGRLLWSDMVTSARRIGFQSIRIEADPGAVEFYVGMGAHVIGVVPSGSIAGRSIPLLEFRT